MLHDQVARQIAATPEQVWSLVADVTRMSEWRMAERSGGDAARGMELTLERIGAIAEAES